MAGIKSYDILIINFFFKLYSKWFICASIVIRLVIINQPNSKFCQHYASRLCYADEIICITRCFHVTNNLWEDVVNNRIPIFQILHVLSGLYKLAHCHEGFCSICTLPGKCRQQTIPSCTKYKCVHNYLMTVKKIKIITSIDLRSESHFFIFISSVISIFYHPL